ncbi:MAG TPA: phenol hydroxylase subunit P4 [Candidatus Sulfotelmatobacter sp.]|nr:phenol hydroxylase subunit P4 [Candidatus Sulfotelmatobacter sp.]
MSVVAIDKNYADKVDIRDRVENFHGNQVVYVHWEDHLMFCAALAFPLPPDMPFADLINQILPTYYGMHPDFARISWPAVRWSLDGKPLAPALDKSLKQNGVGHKSCLRFWTPGLNGVKHSRS